MFKLHLLVYMCWCLVFSYRLVSFGTTVFLATISALFAMRLFREMLRPQMTIQQEGNMQGDNTGRFQTTPPRDCFFFSPPQQLEKLGVLPAKLRVAVGGFNLFLGDYKQKIGVPKSTLRWCWWSFGWWARG